MNQNLNEINEKGKKFSINFLYFFKVFLVYNISKF